MPSDIVFHSERWREGPVNIVSAQGASWMISVHPEWRGPFTARRSDASHVVEQMKFQEPITSSSEDPVLPTVVA
jgi:hypothetical protein